MEVPFHLFERMALQFPIGIEWIIILAIIALVLFLGPTKLPELAKGLGKAMGEFRRGKMEVERQLREEVSATDTYERDSGSQKVVEISPRITEAARELGIEIGSRKERTLKMEIIRALEKETDEKLENVGRLLGIDVEDLDPEQLKDRIGKALGI